MLKTFGSLLYFHAQKVKGEYEGRLKSINLLSDGEKQ